MKYLIIAQAIIENIRIDIDGLTLHVLTGSRTFNRLVQLTATVKRTDANRLAPPQS
jgi:hypothetical protein